MKALCLHPLFFAGAAVRLALVLALAPAALDDWYAPFLQASVERFGLDPWGAWLAAGGDPLAFPYGYAMWLAFLPFALAGELLSLPAQYGYWATLAAVDVGLLACLRRLLPDLPARQLLVYYWLSPIVLLAGYALGLNDLVPVLLMTLAFVLARPPAMRAQLAWSGAVCALAVSAKLSMVVCVPFFLIYLYNGKLLRRHLPAFLAGLALSAACFIAPFLLSQDGWRMLFENPEMQRVYRLRFTFDDGVSLYIVPALYMVALYWVWVMKRINFELFLAGTSVSFLLVTLFASTSPGWFIWNMPFLLFFLSTGHFSTRLLVGALSAAYALDTLLSTPFRLADGAVLEPGRWAAAVAAEQLPSLVHTALVVAGVVLVFHVWRNLVARNDFYRLSRKPFVLGIAGDSGSGKSTLAAALADVIGTHSIVEVSGDDYHHWDRHSPMWKALTHLNPAANDLERLGDDLTAMADRMTIVSPKYDHALGKMSVAAPVGSNDFIMATGLHTLYTSALREVYDLKVYLDMDEGLRRHFKQRRDAAHRGYSAAQVAEQLRRREDDSRRFIRPQRAHADLVFSLQPGRPEALPQADGGGAGSGGAGEAGGSGGAGDPGLHLRLKVRAVHIPKEASLIRALIGVCGLHVDVTPGAAGADAPASAAGAAAGDEKLEMTIDGEVSAADIALAAEMTCGRVLELLDMHPRWQDGVTGLMQVVTLCHIDRALTRRLA